MNNKLEVIGIDHGWSMMKTISQVFVTGVKEITTTPALFGDVLEYEGKQFAFMCELYDYVENTELPPEMVSSLMKTKNVLELSWDEWLMNAEVEDMEDSIEKVAELLRKGKI